MSYEVPKVQIEIVSGDSYKAAEGRALKWFNAEYPNLALAELTFTFGVLNIHTSVFAPIPIIWTSTIGASATHVASLELSREQTLVPEEGCYDYTLQAKFPDDDYMTLAIGKITVLSSPGQQASTGDIL